MLASDYAILLPAFRYIMTFANHHQHIISNTYTWIPVFYFPANKYIKANEGAEFYEVNLLTRHG